jgi:hypothetical protein
MRPDAITGKLRSVQWEVRTKDLHSSICRLNLDQFYHCKHPTYPPKAAHVEVKSGGVSAKNCLC